jgi:hypothetical protein
MWPEAPRAKARINGYTDTGAFLVYRLAPYWYILLFHWTINNQQTGYYGMGLCTLSYSRDKCPVRTPGLT